MIQVVLSWPQRGMVGGERGGGWGMVASYFSLEMFKMFDKHCPRLEWGYFGLFLLPLPKTKTTGINSKP